MKPELVDHRKFLRLKRLLGEPTPHVLGYLLMMWRRGYQTGNPLLGDELDVEAAAEYLGEPHKFATAAHESGFLDRTGDGLYRIHDLWEHAPEWARKRMARTGHLPEGMNEYHGIRPKSCRTAEEPRAKLPNGRETARGSAERHTEDRRQKTNTRGRKELPAVAGDPDPPPDVPPLAPDPPPAKAIRPRDDLFDAIIAVTGCDAKVNGSQVGRVKKLLTAAEPPYTPAEVLRFADPIFRARELPWKNGEKVTIGELEKYIGRVRNPSETAKPAPARFQTPEQREIDQMARYAEDALGIKK